MVDLSFRFDRWFETLPSSPKDRGRVQRCVLRTGPGQRSTPASIELVAGEGALGDVWKVHRYRAPGNEISLINVHVLRSLARGDEDRMPLSGDNLQVDLDLSVANLPPGTELRVGQAVLRVGSLPHQPCRHFAERFGKLAVKKVARANRLGRRGRGVLCEIVRGGKVSVGDEIAVERP